MIIYLYSTRFQSILQILKSTRLELEEDTKVEINSETALAVGYVIKKSTNNKQSKEVLRRLLHWENNRELKLDLKRNKARRG